MEDHPPRRFFARNFIHLVQMEIDNFIKEDPRRNFIPHLDTFFLFSILGRNRTVISSGREAWKKLRRRVESYPEENKLRRDETYLCYLRGKFLPSIRRTDQCQNRESSSSSTVRFDQKRDNSRSSTSSCIHFNNSLSLSLSSSPSPTVSGANLS